MSHRYPTERLLALARELFHEHGSDLTLRQFAKAAGVSMCTVVNHVGNWLDFKQSFGLDPVTAPKARIKPRNTPTALIERLQQVAAKHGQNFTLNFFQRKTGINASTIYNRFGSWTEFRARAGLIPETRMSKRIPTDALLADLVRLCLETRTLVTRRRYRLEGRASLDTLLLRYGTWHAVEAAWLAYMGQLIERFPDRDKRLAYVNRLSETLQRPTNFQEDP